MFIESWDTFCGFLLGGYIMYIAILVIIGISLFRTLLYKLGGGRPYWNICDTCNRLVTVSEIEYCSHGMCCTCCAKLYREENRICTNNECAIGELWEAIESME